MHILIGAAALLYIVTTLGRLISQWRLNRDIRRHLPPAGGWPAQCRPAPPAEPPAEPIIRGDTWTLVAFALATLGVFWLCVAGAPVAWSLVFR